MELTLTSKKIRMRNYLYIYVLLATLIFTGCDDELQVSDPTTIGTDQFITDLATAQQAMDGVYDAMQSVYVQGAYPIMSLGLYADEFSHSGSYTLFDEMVLNNVPATNLAVTYFWSYRYIVIFRANSVINATQALADVDEAARNSIIAEAKGIRALMYFDLVRMFGGVPLPSEDDLVSNNGAASANVARSTEAEVYQYILNDISDAQGEILENDVYHFSDDALNVLLAEVQMTLGNYEEATAALENIIGSYSLVESYDAVFTSSSNTEEIFRIRYSTDDSNNLAFYFYPSALGGRREVAPEASFLEAFEDGDQRINLVTNSDDFSSSYISKYSNVSTGTDQPYVYRYAEVELLYAELLARSGDFDGASDYLNNVRNRAGLGDLSLTSENYIDLLSQERRIELFAEGKRWYDAVRLDILDEVVANKSSSSLNENRILWPIPQDEINANQALSQEDQNPGY